MLGLFTLWLLKKQLRSKKPERRKEAVDSLRSLVEIGTIVPLIEELEYGNDDAQEAAKLALVAIGSSVIRPLVGKLKDADRPTAYMVTSVLAEISAAAIQALFSEPPYRSNYEDSLVKLLKNAAVEVLGKISDKQTICSQLASLENEDSDQVPAEALEPISAAVVEPLITILISERSADSRLSNLQESAKLALARIGLPTVEPLMRMFYYTIADARAAVAETLGEIGDKQAVVTLVTALKDEYYGVREVVAEALGKIGDKRAVRPLIEALKDQPKGPIAESYHVREKAAIALGKIGDRQAVQPLIELLNDENPSLCVHAASALGELGDPKADQPLMKLLKYWNRETQMVAAEALSKIGAVQSLIELLRHWNSEVRVVAAEALGKIGDGRAIRPLLEARRYALDIIRADGEADISSDIVDAKEIERAKGVYRAIVESLRRIEEN